MANGNDNKGETLFDDDGVDAAIQRGEMELLEETFFGKPIEPSDILLMNEKQLEVYVRKQLNK